MHLNLVEIIHAADALSRGKVLLFYQWGNHAVPYPMTVSAEDLQGLMFNYQDWMSLSWRVKFCSTLYLITQAFSYLSFISA